MKKKATINDVAKLAGVSKSTISYVLSGKRSISEQVTKRVLEVMEQLDYKPSVLARNLAERKTYAVGLYGPGPKTIRQDLFFNLILSGILESLNARGYRLLLSTEKKTEDNRIYYDLDRSQPVDGAIIMNPGADSDFIESLSREKLPFVILGRPVQNSGIFYVDNDNTATLYNAVQFLFSKGHRNILLINGPEEYVSSKDREKGYRLAYQEQDFALNEKLIINAGVMEEQGYEVCSHMWEKGEQFTAILATNDIVAVGALKALQERKVKVPEKIAVVSIGDTLVSQINSPPVTSINMNAYRLGFDAAQLLVDIIEKKRITACNVIVPSHLIERETT